MKQQKGGFTLVELIVVITILAILGTIAFIAFGGYSKNARDSVRLSDISNMKVALELWITRSGTYPIPTNAVPITYSGSEVWEQGSFGDSVTTAVGKLSKKPLDPKYNTEYTYSVTALKKEFQIATILEQDTAAMFVPQTYAADGEVAYVSGTYNGILTTISASPAYIIALPSIMLTDTTVKELKTINPAHMVYKGKTNLPSSYTEAGVASNQSDYSFTPQVVWSGATLSALNNQTEFQNFVSNLQTVYKAEPTFAVLPEYSFITAESNNSEVAMNFTKNLIEITVVQSLINVSTEAVFNSCSFDSNPVPHNSSVTAYQTSSVAYGNTCTAESRICNDGVLSGTYTYPTCTVDSGAGTFSLSSGSVGVGLGVTISDDCTVAPTSYTSSNESVATISGTTITGVGVGTTQITPVGGACGDSSAKTLTVAEMDPDFSNVLTLYHADDTDGSTTFTPDVGEPITRNGDVVISANQSKFGGTSLYFDGSGDSISFPLSGAYWLDGYTKNFTIEFWIYPTAYPTSGYGELYLSSKGPTFGSVIYMQGNGILIGKSGNSQRYSDAALPLNTWSHVVLQAKNSDGASLYVNGVLQGTTFNPSQYASGSPTLTFGNNFKGYMDDLRVTKIKRYSGASFTVPTSAFPNQ